MEFITTKLPEIKGNAIKIAECLKEKGGIKNIVCVACGGTHGTFYPVEFFLRTESQIPVYSLNAAEFSANTPACVGENTLVMAGSLSGNTKEVIEAVNICKEKGSIIYGFTGCLGGKLEKESDYTAFFLPEEPWNTVDTQVQYMSLVLANEILHLIDENYAKYESMLDGFEKISGITSKAIKKIEKRAKEFGEQHKDDAIVYTIASGASEYVAYMQSICMFMEMEWVHSSSINSAEYFHGPFEITDPDVPFMFFMSAGSTRKLDERAYGFMQRYGKRISLIDAAELGINSIKDDVVTYFNPLLLYPIALVYSHGLADAKQHPLLMRRYMGKVQY